MNLPRALYGLIWIFCLPFIKRYLRKRALKSPDYLKNWDERFASKSFAKRQHVIWIHAVSVGETRAAAPIIAALQKYFPEAPLLITQMTPTGRATAEALYPQAEVRYLPYDRAKYAARFFAEHRPLFGVLMETELWPNLIHAGKQANVPLFLINARLSEQSLRGYLRIKALIKPALNELNGICAQSAEDAQRFLQLGAGEILVCGNSKYDVTPDPAQLKQGEEFISRAKKRQVFLCASSRDGEEQLILNAWKIFSNNKAFLLVIVPRHPERFMPVEQLIKAHGFNMQRRSDNQKINENTQVWLGDSMGEMFAYYALADIAFIGGSLLEFGGQNLIEAAAMGVPTLFGSSMFNFQQASELALASQAAIQVKDAAELIQQAIALLNDQAKRQQMQSAALEFSNAHRGASKKTADFIYAVCRN